MKIRIVYYENQEIKVKDIDSADWIKKCPNSILQLYFEQKQMTWTKLSGQNSYFLKVIDGLPYFGSVSNSNLHTIDGKQKYISLENMIIPTQNLKFGITVSDEIWKKVSARSFVP